MLLQEDIQNREEYIYIKVSGSYTGKDEVPGLMQTAAETASANHYNKILIDLSLIKGFMPAFDKYDLGEAAAKIWGHKYKIAIIYLQGEITGMFENVAVNRGGNIKVVNNMKEAESWLLQQ